MKFNLEITTVIGCKNLCSYCPQEKLINAYKSKTTQMSFDTFKKCIDKLSIETDMHFTGMAEPFLNSNCLKMIQYADQKGHKILVSTTLVGLEGIPSLEKIPFKEFWVHLPSKDTNIKIDKKYLNTLKELAKSKINAFYHYHDILHPKINMPARKVALINRAGNLNVKSRRNRGKIECRRIQPVLLPNGDVLLCCMDYGMKHVLGNLLDDNWIDLFKGSEYSKVVRGWKNPKMDILCRYCDSVCNVNLTAKIFNNLSIKKIIKGVIRRWEN